MIILQLKISMTDWWNSMTFPWCMGTLNYSATSNDMIRSCTLVVWYS